MTTKLCPKCGTITYRNRKGELICPNHGIVLKEEQEESQDKSPDYLG